MGIEALLSTQIIDTTAVGRSVMTAADAAAARTAIGAGTSSFSGAYSALSGIPSTFAPSAHKTSHATGGSDALTAADIGAAATSHTHAASDITSGTIATARLASGTANSTTYLRGDQTWASVSAGVGGSTGSVDNGVLRADGTGGSTVQSSDWIIADNYTASPNNTVNHASIQATGGTTNVSVSIVPKGTGAFCLAVPDGTATGGNARGANAVDLQLYRASATQVASGQDSFAAGYGCTASNQGSICIGYGSTSSNQGSICFGSQSTASGIQSIVIGGLSSASGIQSIAMGGGGAVATGIGSISIGYYCTASGQTAFSVGYQNLAAGERSVATGIRSLANRYGQRAHAGGSFTNNPYSGQAQCVEFVLRNKTTDGTTAVTLFLDGETGRLTIRTGTILHATTHILGSKSDGSVVAEYMRQVCIKNVSGTTTLVGTVNTLGVDTAAGTSIAITADDTNDALQIAVTGVAAETWRWVAVVYGVELAYGA